MARNPIVDSRDVRFILFEMLDIEQLNSYEKYSEFDRDTYEEIIDLAEKIAVEQVYPVNSDADKEHANYNPDTKEVIIPECFRPGLDAYYEAGFAGIAIEPEYGGLGMPFIIFQSTLDYFASAGVAFSMYPHLSLGAMGLVKQFGREEDRQVVCEKIISGEWGGTMCLTEPDAGSDVGALKSKAVQVEGDTYALKGQKIFISTGENNYYKNMIHPVLARIEGHPAGTKGVSIFMTPKYRFTPDGAMTGPNDVVCSGIEHKMGITASPTCTLNFGDSGQCEGILMGEECQGMKIMFHMMNETRLYVGLQGMSASSAAYMHAVTYARNRIQGADPENPKAGNTFIINHADVRRMLLSMKARVEAMRSLVYYTTFLIDIAKVETGDVQKEAQAMVDFLIPITKAGNTDTAWDVTSDAIQVYGGYGFTNDYPVEQYARDSKILSLYEGTNGIQSIDLAMRKLLLNKEQFNYRVYRSRIEETISAAEGTVDTRYIETMKRGLRKLDEMVEVMKTRQAEGDVAQVFADATPMQKAFVMMTYAWMHLWGLTAALPKLKELTGDAKGRKLEEIISDNQEAAYYHGRVLSGRFYLGAEFQKFFGMADYVIAGESSVKESMDASFSGAPEGESSSVIVEHIA